MTGKLNYMFSVETRDGRKYTFGVSQIGYLDAVRTRDLFLDYLNHDASGDDREVEDALHDITITYAYLPASA